MRAFKFPPLAGMCGYTIFFFKKRKRKRKKKLYESPHDVGHYYALFAQFYRVGIEGKEAHSNGPSFPFEGTRHH
jgi:hypothetical protein